MYHYYGPTTESLKKRNEAILRARSILQNKDHYIIVDTETSGLDEDDVIIHFAAMDLDRNMLIDSYVRPTRKQRIGTKAKEIHGIGMKDLKGAPIFEKILEQFVPMYEGKTILSYRAIFHSRMISQTIEEDGIARLDVSFSDFECIQERYEDFYGRSYLSMPGRDNTGIGDCNAALDVIEEIALADLSEIQVEPEPPIKTNQSTSPFDRKYWPFVLIFIGIVTLFAHAFIIGVPSLLYGIYLYKKKK